MKIKNQKQFYNLKKHFLLKFICYKYIDNLMTFKPKIQNELHFWSTAAPVNSWGPGELYARNFSDLPFLPQPLDISGDMSSEEHSI